MRHHLTECSCGSGLWPDENYDARGIFLCYSCEECRVERLAGFRPDVLSDPDYWHDEPLDADDGDYCYMFAHSNDVY